MIAGLLTKKVNRTIKLHDYQRETVDAANSAWKENAKNVMAVLPH